MDKNITLGKEFPVTIIAVVIDDICANAKGYAFLSKRRELKK